MFCRNCGKNLDDGVAFCPGCGTAVQAPPAQEPAPQQPVYQQPAPQQPVYQQSVPVQPAYQQPVYQQQPVVFVEAPPMKWFKFLIYFSLWAGAVLNLISGIAMMSGSSYEGAADLVYAMFDGLQGLDTFCGLYAIALAAFGIFVRFQLAGYKKKAPLMLMILYIAAAAYGLIYIIGINAILPSYVLEAVDTTSMYSSMISSGVMVIINHIYFKKRAHMFVA